jgi:hypothetical protein
MNKDKNKVFVVTSGEYSDYTISRVFSTRKKALEYLDTKDDSYRLEVYDLDEPIERKTELYCITFRFDQKRVEKVQICCVGGKKDLIRARRTYSGVSVLDIYMESDSRKRALKIASERYGAIIAGEQTMYPYLRVGVLRHYGNMVPAYFDFHTGELVLFDRQELAVELPAFIKIRKVTNP